jgi:hypothetical protein
LTQLRIWCAPCAPPMITATCTCQHAAVVISASMGILAERFAERLKRSKMPQAVMFSPLLLASDWESGPTHTSQRPSGPTNDGSRALRWSGATHLANPKQNVYDITQTHDKTVK